VTEDNSMRLKAAYKICLFSITGYGHRSAHLSSQKPWRQFRLSVVADVDEFHQVAIKVIPRSKMSIDCGCARHRARSALKW
jgi:hypothetical protein